MNRTIVSLAAMSVAVLGSAASAEKIKFDYWYGLTGNLGVTLAETCDRFRAC